MTLPLAQPVRFPRDSSGPKRKTPLGLFEQLVRAAMLDGLTRAEAVAQVRTEFPFLKEATMTNSIVLDDGTMIEAPLTFRQAGDEVDEVSGSAKTLVEKVRIARELRPEAARVYEIGPVIQGPQVTYRPLRGEELLAQLKSDFNHAPGVPGATTLRAVLAAINAWVISEAVRTGKDPRMAWSQAVANDSNLREAAGMTPAAAGAVTEGGA